MKLISQLMLSSDNSITAPSKLSDNSRRNEIAIIFACIYM